MDKLFLDRKDAGIRLAKELTGCKGSDVVVLAIPRGGVPVGYQAARELGVDFDLIISRKLPVPWNPEAGFGAVTAEGNVVLNRRMVEPLGLEEGQIDFIAGQVRAEIVRRENEFRGGREPVGLEGRTVIIIDDGIASGYTMLAAVESVRRRNPKQVIVAAPVASSSSVLLLKPKVDRLVVMIESHHLPFAVADFYLRWHDLDDREVHEFLDRIGFTKEKATTDEHG